MKNNLLKKIYFIMVIMFITVIMFTINSYAFQNTIEEINETEYISIKAADLSTRETEIVNISTKEMGNSLESYVPKNDVSIFRTTRDIVSPRAIIGGIDNRWRIVYPTDYPYSAVAYVLTTWQDGSQSEGTAFMISSDKAMSCAHVVYNAEKGLAQTVQVIPAKNGPFFWNNPYGATYADSVYYPQQYTTANPLNTSALQYDWCIMKLDEPMGVESGWLNLQSGGVTIGEQGEYFYVAGYPVHHENSSNYNDFQTDEWNEYDREYQYCAAGRILSSSFYYYIHNIDALPGQSGAPLYKIAEDGSVYVLGIHAAEASDYLVNYACRISPTIINTATSF